MCIVWFLKGIGEVARSGSRDGRVCSGGSVLLSFSLASVEGFCRSLLAVLYMSFFVILV